MSHNNSDVAKPVKRKAHNVAPVEDGPKSELDVFPLKVVVDPEKFANGNPNKRCMFYKVSINDLIANRKKLQGYDKLFSHEVKPILKSTDQKQTGTCWMMAGLNIIRQKMIKDNKFPKNFELSKAHLYFWDKIEKCNWFLNMVCRTKETNFDLLEVQDLFLSVHYDGGTWSMFKNLVQKYGLMPKTVYGDDKACKNSCQLNSILNKQISMYGRELRAFEGDSFSLIPRMMNKLYSIISTVMGEPPKKFDYRYLNKTEELQTIKDITPLDFRKKYAKIDLEDYVNVCSDDRIPYGSILKLTGAGNVISKDNLLYYNLSLDRLVNLVKTSIKDNESVFFTADVTKDFSHAEKLMDDEQYNYNILGLTFHKHRLNNRHENLKFKTFNVCHAMVFRGVDIKEHVDKTVVKESTCTSVTREKKTESIVKWKVENSWGDDVHYSMSHSWFLNNVYSAVILKSKLSAEELKIYEKDMDTANFVVKDSNFV